jgi:hypothetical protein
MPRVLSPFRLVLIAVAGWPRARVPVGDHSLQFLSSKAGSSGTRSEEVTLGGRRVASASDQMSKLHVNPPGYAECEKSRKLPVNN